MRHVWFLAVFTLGCAHTGGSRQDPRTLHYVGDELVHSRPPAPGAYTAYFNARMALELDPPDLEAAREHLRHALRHVPDDPHLWVALAEVELRAGDEPSATVALDRALSLAPNYPPAQALHAQLRDGSIARHHAE